MTSTFSSTNRWTFFFLGLDNNQFAVEVAKVTMMMAKKLAADELDEHIDALPLDNLDETICCADALFHPWPKANVIIGNPPFRRMSVCCGRLCCCGTTRRRLPLEAVLDAAA
jgi:hypothetical protein